MADNMFPGESPLKKMDRRPILIVEDDGDDQLFLTDSLKKAGVTNPLIVQKSGKQCVDYLNQHTYGSKMPCLVILDLGLPDIRGIELLKEIRQNAATRPIPVIVMTHSQKEEDIINSYMVGANSYIRKTFDTQKFQEEMNLFVSYWLELCQLPA